MSKYYVEKYVKIPVLIEVDADDEFGALHNIAHGDYDSYEFCDFFDDWVIGAYYTIIYDKEYKEVRRMTNEVAASYIN